MKAREIQRQVVLNWLKERGELTVFDAVGTLHILSLDENDSMLLEFLNEFDKWRAYKELMDSIRMAQKKGEANED